MLTGLAVFCIAPGYILFLKFPALEGHHSVLFSPAGREIVFLESFGWVFGPSALVAGIWALMRTRKHGSVRTARA
jgi:hypothetical protein